MDGADEGGGLAEGFEPVDGRGAFLRRLVSGELGRRLRAVPGRETFELDEGGGLIVKRSRGDLARDGWYERLRHRSSRPPGRREFENLAGLAVDGLPVPRAVGWARVGDLSAVAMERVEHRETLRDRLESSPSEALRWAEELAGLVARMHESGWYHRDLYLQHWLLAPGPELVLIDVGRARKERAPRRRWFVKDLAGLLHSTPSGVGAAARLRFLASYLDQRGIWDGVERRRWASKVEAKRRRIAGHAPRYGESGSAYSS